MEKRSESELRMVLVTGKRGQINFEPSEWRGILRTLAAHGQFLLPLLIGGQVTEPASAWLAATLELAWAVQEPYLVQDGHGRTGTRLLIMVAHSGAFSVRFIRRGSSAEHADEPGR